MKALLTTTLISIFTSSAFALFVPQGNTGFDISCQNEKMQVEIRLPQGNNETAALQITDFEAATVSSEAPAMPFIKSGAQVFTGENFKLAIVYGDGQMTGVFSSTQKSEKLACQTIYHIMQNSQY